MTITSMSEKTTNFFFANCMKCEGIIRIPITIRPDSSVSCPHCSSQFDLIDFLDQIPAADITEGGTGENQSDSDSGEFKIETESGAEKVNGKYVVPAQLAAGMRKRRRRRRRRSSSESAPEGSVPSPTTTSTTTEPARQLSEAEELKIARREDRAQRERDKLKQQREAAAERENIRQRGGVSRRRRPAVKRNPVMEAFKIIIGGLLAAPIAYLLLMWVFSRDPLGLAPQINNYAPMLVPPIFEPQEDGLVPSAGSNEADPSDLLSDSDSDSDFGDEFKEKEYEDEFENDVEIP